jgi:hypothetical protein
MPINPRAPVSRPDRRPTHHPAATRQRRGAPLDNCWRRTAALRDAARFRSQHRPAAGVQFRVIRAATDRRTIEDHFFGRTSSVAARQQRRLAACAVPVAAPSATAGAPGQGSWHDGFAGTRSGDTAPTALSSARPRAHPSPPSGCDTSTLIALPRTACRPAAPRDQAPGHTPCCRRADPLTIFCGDFLHHLNLEIAPATSFFGRVSPPRAAAGPLTSFACRALKRLQQANARR